VSQDESKPDLFTPKKVLVAFCVAIVVMSFFAYGGSLTNRFTNWDDNWLITENRIIQGDLSDNLGHVIDPTAPREELGNEYLPVRDLSYMLNHAVGDLSPFGYHFIDLLLHIFVSLLVMLLAWRLTKKHWLAGLAGLLFAVHPVHVEAVAWASSRKDMLSTFFLMLSVHLYITARRERPESPSLRKKLHGTKRALGLAAGCFVLAMMSKMTAVVLPALLLGIEVFFGSQLAKADAKSRITKQVPFWAIALAFTIMAMSIGSGLMREPYGDGRFQSVLTAISALTRDFQVLFTGYPMHAAVDLPVQTGFSGSVVIGLLIGLVLIGLTFWGFKESRRQDSNPLILLTAFCALWFVASLAPVSNILVQIGTVFAERYLYIPSIGFCIALAAGMDHLGKSKVRKTLLPILATGVPVIVVLGTVFTSIGASHWENSETLWQHSVEQDPGNHIAYFNLGREYHERSQNESDEAKRNKLLDSAFENYEHALANPARTYRNDPARVYGQMSLVEVTRGNTDNALVLILKAFDHIEQPWRDERATNDIVSLLETPHGMALSAKGDFEGAVAAFRRSIEASDKVGRPSGSRINLAQELARHALAGKAINESELKEAYEQLDAYDESRGEQVLISLHARARIKMKEFDARLAASGKGGEREIPSEIKPIIEEARELYRTIIKSHIPTNMRNVAASGLYLEAADAMARGRAGDETAEHYLKKSLELYSKREGTRYLLSQLFFERAEILKKPMEKARARRDANTYLQEELSLHPDYKPAKQLLAVGLRQKAVDEAARIRRDYLKEYKAVAKTEDDPTWQGLIITLYENDNFQKHLLAIVALLRDSLENDPESTEGHMLMEGTGLLIALGMWFTHDDTMRVNAEELLRTAFNANPVDSEQAPNPVARVLTQFYLELAEKLVYRPDEKVSLEQRRKDMSNLLINMLSLSDEARKILSGKLRIQAVSISEGPYIVKDADGTEHELSKGTRDMMASELMRAAIALNPENITALDWLKNYFEDEGNLEEAIKTFEQLVAALKDRPDLMHGVFLSLAQLQLDLGEQQLRSFKHKLKLGDTKAAHTVRDKAIRSYIDCIESTEKILSANTESNLSMAVRIRGAAAQRLAYLDTSRAPQYYDIAIEGYERVPADFKQDMAEVRRKRSWFFTDPYEKLSQLKKLLKDAPASMDTSNIEADIRALEARIADLEATQYLKEGHAEKALTRIQQVMNTPTPQLFATRGEIYLALRSDEPQKYRRLAAIDLLRATTEPTSLLKGADLYWKDEHLMFEDDRYLRARSAYERAFEVLEMDIPNTDPESADRKRLEILRDKATRGMREMNGLSNARVRAATDELNAENLPEALRLVSDALDMAGQNLEAWKVKSRVYRAMAKQMIADGDLDASTDAFEEARNCIVAAIRLDPPLKSQQLSLLLELGELLVESGDKLGARVRLDAARQVFSLAPEPVRNTYKSRLDALAESLK
jgi:tetratricopeptide (TPR) repeat protein